MSKNLVTGLFIGLSLIGLPADASSSARDKELIISFKRTASAQKDPSKMNEPNANSGDSEVEATGFENDVRALMARIKTNFRGIKKVIPLNPSTFNFVFRTEADLLAAESKLAQDCSFALDDGFEVTAQRNRVEWILE